MNFEQERYKKKKDDLKKARHAVNQLVEKYHSDYSTVNGILALYLVDCIMELPVKRREEVVEKIIRQSL